MTTELPRTGPASPPRSVGGYLLGARVGEGGMGVVHRSRMPDGRDVAIKVLRPHIAGDAQARERLRREVATLERVAHPRVAAVLDADVDGPAPFLVTEFVPGAPLDAVVAEQGPLTPEGLVRLGRGLTEALRAIHAVGIVHRDLKPGNVLMVGEDPVVIDFGIAQVTDDVRLTMTGMVMGTPGYLSPEVVEGGSVTEATDWWGWAATLAFAASGEPPFGRGPMTVVLDRVIRGRTQLTGVDPDLRPLLLAALDPDPARRPTSPEVMAALEAYAGHRPVEEVLGADLTQVPADPDLTQVHAAVDLTRVQPVLPTPPTRLQPQLEPPQERVPRPVPASFGRPPEPYQVQPVPHQLQAFPYQPPPNTYPVPTAYPPPGVDPRIGRPQRTGTLAALLVLVVGLSTLLPVVAWGALALWSVLSRWADRAITGLVLRRHEAGRRSSDLPITLLAAPWHVVTSVLAAGLSLILPLALALVTAGITAFGMGEVGTVPVGIGDPVPVGAGTLMGVVISWWGPGGVSLRRGSRTLVRTVVTAGVLSRVVAALLLVTGIALGARGVLQGEEVSWWPSSATSEVPLIDQILPQIP